MRSTAQIKSERNFAAREKDGWQALPQAGDLRAAQEIWQRQINPKEADHYDRKDLEGGKTHHGMRSLSASAFDGFGFGTDIQDRAAHDLDLHILGNFNLDMLVVNVLGYLADKTAAKNHLIPPADLLQHFLMGPLPLLLRADQQEIHDHENQDERHQLYNDAAGARRCGGPLRECGGNEHVYSPVETGFGRFTPAKSWQRHIGHAGQAQGGWTRGKVAGSHSSMTDSLSALAPLLARIAEALERLAPGAASVTDLDRSDAFVWHPHQGLQAVAKVNRVALPLLIGIDRNRDQLVENTLRFAKGLPANNVLLWGARGMGKSSLVKAAHADVNERGNQAPLKLVEIHREDIESLPELMNALRGKSARFLIFCDDLSFDSGDASYKSLKAVLEGGVEGRPENVLFYATSNRRHLMPREMIENESSTAINPSEAVEEKVSLSDRFGLWLGFHKCSQDDYLAMVNGYAAHFGLVMPPEKLRAEALEWSMTRGSRTGRVAFQFIQDLAGRLGQQI
jgi:uncharacterized protein